MVSPRPTGGQRGARASPPAHACRGPSQDGGGRKPRNAARIVVAQPCGEGGAR